MQQEPKALSKIFSFEFVVSALALMFSLGAGYAALAAADEKNTDSIRNVDHKVSVLSVKQDGVSKDVQEIRVDIGKIQTSSQAQGEAIQETRQEMQQIRRDIQQLLREIRK